MVEDSEDDAALILLELSRGGYEPFSKRVYTPSALHEALEECEWDIVISDYSMPAFNGMGALEIFKSAGADIPFIMVSGAIGEEKAIEAMKNGAHDFVSKKNLSRLAPAVKRELREAARRRAHRSADIALRESEKKYRMLIETASDAIFVADAETGVLLEANKRAEELVGRPKEQLIGSHQSTLHPKDKAELYKKLFLKAVREKQKFSEDSLYVARPDGREIPVDIRANVIDTDGRKLIFGVFRDITEREKALRALRESERMLSEAQKVARMGSWEWSLRDGKASCTEQMCRILGFEPGEFEPSMENFLKLVHPDDRSYVEKSNEEALKTMKPFEMEFRIIRLDGTERYLQSRGRVDLDEGGKPFKMSGVVLDITKRKKAELDLQQSESLLRKVLNTLPVGVWVTDIEGKIMMGNPAGQRIWAGARYVGVEEYGEYKGWWTDTGKRIEPEEWALARAIRKGETSLNEVIDIECFDGTRKTIYNSAMPIKDEMDNIIGAIVVNEDITEKRRAEEKLLLASKVIENTSEGMMVTDPEGVIQMVNPAFTSITQYTPKEAIGQTPRILRSDRHDQDFYRDMWRVLITTGRWEGEIWNRRKNGEAYPEWLTISAVKGGQGETTNYVALFHDMTERKQSEEEIRYHAYHDALTGLPNRQVFRDRLDMAMARAGRNHEKLAVFFVDLDNFKNINDGMGHAVGDLFLQGVATRLVGALREEDTVSRFGGDEFTIIVEDIKEEYGVDHVAKKIFEALAVPFKLEGHDLYITASIGISIFPDDGEDGEALMQNADAAMYRAKERGKNNYMLYTPEMNVRLFERLALESSLRKAIEREEFLLYYQPKISLATGKIVGMEALVRWNHPDLGLVPPVHFIPLAEETGLIIPIGEWVLDTALSQLKKWHDAGYDKLSMAINLSARQFAQDNLDVIVEEALRKNGAPPRSLEVEVTESMVMTDIENTVNTLRSLGLMGVRISIDDFGTGYSSLSYIKKFLIDSLKIDRSFVLDLSRDPDDASIVTAIISMAKGLGLKVVAEGVESEEQLEFLRERGCDEAQGYYFSPPVPEDKFRKLLEKERE